MNGDFGGQVLSFVIVLVVILVSMTLHELMHGVVAYWLGDDTAKNDGRLSLNPLKHLDPVYSILVPVLLYLMGGPIFGGAKPVPVDANNLKYGRAWGMAVVAIAGPLTNLILAYLGFLLWYFAGNRILVTIGQLILSVNLGFACFNILPIPPLDGSRILYAVAPDGVRELMNRLEYSMGTILVYVLILVFGGMISGVMAGMINGIVDVFLWTVGV